MQIFKKWNYIKNTLRTDRIYKTKEYIKINEEDKREEIFRRWEKTKNKKTKRIMVLH